MEQGFISHVSGNYISLQQVEARSQTQRGSNPPLNLEIFEARQHSEESTYHLRLRLWLISQNGDSNLTNLIRFATGPSCKEGTHRASRIAGCTDRPP